MFYISKRHNKSNSPQHILRGLYQRKPYDRFYFMLICRLAYDRLGGGGGGLKASVCAIAELPSPTRLCWQNVDLREKWVSSFPSLLY